MVISLHATLMFPIVLGHEDFVADVQQVGGQSQPVVYLEGGLGVYILVGGPAHVLFGSFVKQVQVAPADGGNPSAVVPAVTRMAGGEQGGVEETESHFVVLLRRRLQRGHVHDPAQALPEGRRKAPGVDIHGTDDPRIDGAEDAVEILQVKRVVQAQPIEAHHGFAGFPAAHVGPGADAVGYHPRQTGHSAQRIVPEIGHVVDVLARQQGDGFADGPGELKLAGRDDDSSMVGPVTRRSRVASPDRQLHPPLWHPPPRSRAR